MNTIKIRRTKHIDVKSNFDLLKGQKHIDFLEWETEEKISVMIKSKLSVNFVAIDNMGVIVGFIFSGDTA